MFPSFGQKKIEKKILFLEKKIIFEKKFLFWGEILFLEKCILKNNFLII